MSFCHPLDLKWSIKFSMKSRVEITGKAMDNSFVSFNNENIEGTSKKHKMKNLHKN